MALFSFLFSHIAYLKEIIGNIPSGILTAEVREIGSPEANKNGKLFRKVKFLFPATGKLHEEGVFEFNFTPPRGNLAGLKIGDAVEMKLENGWPIFKILTASSEQQFTQPSQSSYEQVKSERAATGIIERSDSKREEKDIQICLQGFMQAFISSGSTAQEALEKAVHARNLLIGKSAEIRLGLTETNDTTAADVLEPHVSAEDLPF